MASKTPPKKPVYPKQEPPRRPKPARPVYPPGAGAQRAPRRPAEKRLIFDYDKEMARMAAHTQTGQTAAPFVNLAPPVPEDTPSVQNGLAAGAGRPERERREAPPGELFRAAPPQAGRKPAERPTASRRTEALPPLEIPRPAPPNRPLTPRELRRRRIRRAALAGLLAVILLGIGLWASAKVLFKISEIVVETPEGEVRYDTSQITAAFGHVQGENLFGFRGKETQQNIAAALPYLEDVRIRRQLPDTVIITVTPAVEASVVESALGWAVLSQSYKVLRLEAGPPEELVRINGVQAEAPAPGQPLKLTEEDKLPLLQTLLEKTAAQGLVPINEIDLSNTLEISFLYQGRIRIVLGTSNDLDYKLKWAWRMVTPGETSDSLNESDRGTLDVSARGEDGLGRARWRAGIL